MSFASLLGRPRVVYAGVQLVAVFAALAASVVRAAIGMMFNIMAMASRILSCSVAFLCPSALHDVVMTYSAPMLPTNVEAAAWTHPHDGNRFSTRPNSPDVANTNGIET